MLYPFEIMITLLDDKIETVKLLKILYFLQTVLFNDQILYKIDLLSILGWIGVDLIESNLL